MYCIDASVIVNSAIEGEEHHEHSKELIDRIRNENIEIVVPQIILPEISAAITRKTDNEILAMNFVKRFIKVPNITFVQVDESLAIFASEIAAKCKIKGADSVYVAVASRFNVRLITLDDEQRKRSMKIIDVLTPEEEINKVN